MQRSTTFVLAFVLGALALNAPAQAATPRDQVPIARYGDWELHRLNNQPGELPTFRLEQVAEGTQTRAQPVSMAINCSAQGTDLWVEHGLAARGDSALVTLVYGPREREQQRWTMGGAGNFSGRFGMAGPMVADLARYERVALTVETVDGNQTEAAFDLTGLDAGLAELGRNCAWRDPGRA